MAVPEWMPWDLLQAYGSVLVEGVSELCTAATLTFARAELVLGHQWAGAGLESFVPWAQAVWGVCGLVCLLVIWLMKVVVKTVCGSRQTSLRARLSASLTESLVAEPREETRGEESQRLSSEKVESWMNKKGGALRASIPTIRSLLPSEKYDSRGHRRLRKRDRIARAAKGLLRGGQRLLVGERPDKVPLKVGQVAFSSLLCLPGFLCSE